MKGYLKGQSLFGLMSALGISSLLLIGIVKFYQHSQWQIQQMNARLFLQAEIERTLQLISKDLRRTGFRAAVEKRKVDNFALFEQDERGTSLVLSQSAGEKPNSCVLFFYDLDNSGCIGSTYTKGLCRENGKNRTKEIERELFGYRLKHKMLETRLTYKNTVKQKCAKEECQGYLQQLACERGGWVDLFDNHKIAITDFSLQWLKESVLLTAYLKGQLTQQPHIEYESQVVIPLLNQGGTE
ncbi:type II secretion system protein J [Avibacterium sp. 20-15]|uniref:PulJ/GspJ family protein n=1 Tax=unclassified Avibacterium TaxID=2685287 RepID=UPI002026D31D|nr:MULTISPECIES: type II secretion system protein J [unclassified Avibacterium]MCW9732522.1 type II secretion system protein J [Avibacterium sp. 20-15]URL02396.1 type II secretion system protein J [Avibacterium sp. 20-126]URL04678.1 type II secretion system protein J [Avibacterium sp. 20-132]URL07063.1 type II secretion system protein J [Avibacterium sp. 21-595]